MDNFTKFTEEENELIRKSANKTLTSFLDLPECRTETKKEIIEFLKKKSTPREEFVFIIKIWKKDEFKEQWSKIKKSMEDL